MLKKILIPLSLSMALTACGGGGGDAGVTLADASKTYTGNTAQSAITPGNYFEMLGLLFDSSTLSNALNKNASPASEDGNISVRKLSGINDIAIKSLNEYLQTSSYHNKTVAVADTSICTYGGSVSYSGNIDDVTLTGTLAAQFAACDESGGVVVSGNMTMIIRSFNRIYEEPDSYVFSFSNLSVNDGVDSYLATGTFDAVADFANGTSRIIMNLHNDFNGVETLYENVVLSASPSGLTIDGRIYDSTDGYVDVSTLSALQYSFPEFFPVAGGPIILQGSNNATIRITPISGSVIQVELDFDGDGIYEETQEIDTDGNVTIIASSSAT